MVRFVCVAAAVLSLVGCSMDSDPEFGWAAQSLAHDGPWHIPIDVVGIGDQQSVEYTGAGPWVGESGCSDGLEPGSAELRQYILDWFPQVPDVQGFACRAIRGSSTTMSVHGTGRALDIFIPTSGPLEDESTADNDLGDPLGNWLIKNAENIGIQYIIWDRWSWGAHRPVGDKSRSYGGSHPHHDHLHIELSLEAAAQITPFFDGEQGPPDVPRCDPIGAEGATIDDGDPCVHFFGPSQYWRTEGGSGFGNGLHWTNAFESATPSNWARYILDFAEAGEFDVEVYIEPEFGVHRETRYGITHADGVTEVIVDQSTESGWTSLGRYNFDPAMHHDVSLFDNADGPLGAEQHVVADALRLVPVADEKPGPPPADEDEDDVPEFTGGCATGGNGGSGWVCLLGLIALGRRRRDKRS